MKRFILAALLFLAAPAVASDLRQMQMVQLMDESRVCDGVAHWNVKSWTADRAYKVIKVSPRMGVDLYSTQDFQSVVYWWRSAESTVVEVGILQADRAGHTGSNFTDRMTDSIDGFVVQPGDKLILSAYCASFVPNPVFIGVPAHGHAWAYIWIVPTAQ